MVPSTPVCDNCAYHVALKRIAQVNAAEEAIKCGALPSLKQRFTKGVTALLKPMQLMSKKNSSNSDGEYSPSPFETFGPFELPTDSACIFSGPFELQGNPIGLGISVRNDNIDAPPKWSTGARLFLPEELEGSPVPMSPRTRSNSSVNTAGSSASLERDFLPFKQFPLPECDSRASRLDLLLSERASPYLNNGIMEQLPPYSPNTRVAVSLQYHRMIMRREC